MFFSELSRLSLLNMAIIDAFPGLGVFIKMDGREAHEFSNPDDENEPLDERSVVKYTESMAGGNFSIVMWLTPIFLDHTNYPMTAHVYVDGVRTNRRTFSAFQISRGKWEEITHAQDMDENGEQVERRFSFAQMEINKDHELDVPDHVKWQVSGIGEITVAFYRKIVVSGQPKPYQRRKGSRNSRLAPLDNLFTVPEKALKGRAISQRARFGESRPNPIRHKMYPSPNYQYVDKESHPFASFTFRYRSLRDLRAEFIIPWSPSPSPGRYGDCEILGYAAGPGLDYGDDDVGYSKNRSIESRIKMDERSPELAQPCADGEDDEVVFLYSRQTGGSLAQSFVQDEDLIDLL